MKLIKWVFNNKNKGMLEGQNYKELIQEHGVIEQSIAEGWGYEINPTEFIPKKPKIRTNMKVANIEPLRQTSNLPVSKQLQKIDQQLMMMQNERKLQELTQQAKVFLEKEVDKQGDESAAVKMMHQLVDQYNFIVEHRHIVEKNSQKARKILGIQKKTTAQLINQQIEQLKGQLASSSFSEVVKINQKIAELYKKYQANLFVTKNTTQHNTTVKNPSHFNKTTTQVSATNSYIGSSKFSPCKKTSKPKSSAQTSSYPHSNTHSHKKQDKMVDIKDLVIMQQLNESEEGDSMNYQDQNVIDYLDRMQPQSLILENCLVKMQRRTSEYAVRRRMVTAIDGNQREKDLKKQRMATTITQSFVERDVIDKGRSLDKALRQNKEVIDIWKHRIGTNAEKNQATFLKFQPKAKKFKKSLRKNEVNTSLLNEKIEVLDNHLQRPSKLSERIREVKAEMNIKQKVLSIILRKKQSKYKRIPGTQILQKNDVSETAKNFLGIGHNKAQSKIVNTSHHLLTKKCEQEDVPEWMNIGYDQQLYWSMCRNEKINLLLKHK